MSNFGGRLADAFNDTRARLVLLVEPTAQVHEVVLPLGEAERLRKLQEVIGGYLELTRTRAADLWMFCNEDGQRLELEPNDVASAIAGQAIIGPAVFHGGPDAEGELVAIPERWRVILMSQ